MSKQLNIDLNFRANTAQAQQSIQQLQSSLTQIAAAGSLGIGGEKITTEMKQAGQAAKELQMHLTKAFNATTGKLDLNKLNNSLLSSKTTLSSLSKDLMAIGPSGTQAFTQLATSISQANAPMITLNSLFSNLWITMKNTAKWQLTSSMIHGFVGGIQEAYHYAQDLNKSLNNIRIVTGLSVEEMDKFAEKANKAAKALNASTLDYTEAALIYYQQGLRGKAVEERADTTVKMANVTRQSAEEVSDQLTAIWNNFYDGSESLESFADKMVALGAATASSSDEIAGGLEKFAAIGETIGLSFDYAAAALATITSNTRQSEEVVGTALKTIFARMQGLKLGETLEDGVELNKYSQALETIGVDIFDANDQLKNMDQILDETAAKWDTLTKAQQMATAQTVAGIRQYNQFIALMDNWNNGDNDSMVANLQTANTASGALQEQADIYAESWEAAQDRVTASAEAIYQALLDDNFFIGLANMWGDALGGIKEFVDGIGGLKGVFGIAITFITSALASRLGPAIDNIRANFQVMFSSASTQANKLATEMHNMIGVAQQQTGIEASKSQQIQLDNANNLIVAKTKLASVNKNLSSHERMLAEMNISLIESEQQKALTIAETIDKLKEESALLKETMSSSSTAAGMAEKMMSPVDRRFGQLEDQKMQAVASGDRVQITETNNALMALNSQYENIMFSANAAAKVISTEFVAGLEKGGNEVSEGNVILKEYITSLTEFANKNVSRMSTPESLSNARMIVTEYASTLPDAVTKTEDFQKALSALGRVGINGGANSAEQMKKAILNLVQAMGDAKFSTADLRKMMIQLGQGTNVKKFEADIQNLNKKEKELLDTQNRINQAIKNFDPTHKFGKIEKITAFGSALTSVAMTFNSLKSMVNAWKNPDMSFGEKLMTTFMSLGMAIPMVTSGFSNILKMLGLMNAEEMKNISTMALSIITRKTAITGLTEEEAVHYRVYIAKRLSEGATHAQIAAELKSQNTSLTSATILKLLTAEKEREAAMTALQTAADNGNVLAKIAVWTITKLQNIAEGKSILGKKGSIIATWAQTAANWALNASMGPLLLVIIAVTAALAGLILIIWGSIAAIQAITKAYNADAIALEQANAALVEQQEILKETQAAHEELISTLEKYETAYNALQQMTKGTEEWKKQAEDLNKQVIDLITKYPELAKHVERNADGVLSLKSAEIEELKNESDQKVQDAEIRTLQAQRRANNAKQQNDITQMSRNAKGLDMATSIVNGVGLGALAGAKYGLATDTATLGGTMGLGTVLGTVGGALIGGLGGAATSLQSNWVADEQAKEQINNLISGYTAQGENFFTLETTKSALDELAIALGQDKEAIINLIRSNQALEESNRLLIEQEVDQQFKDDEIYQNSKYQDVMREKAANIKEEEAVTQADKDAAEDELFGSYGDDYSKYLEAVYGEDAKNYIVVDTGGKNATVQKYNAETKQYETVGEENGLTQDQAIEAVAQAKANERANARIANELDTAKFEKEAKGHEEKFEQGGLSDTAATEIAKAIMGKTEVNFANMNQSDIDQLTSYSGNDADIQKYAEQAREFEKDGGVLNAVNSSYKDIYAAATEQKDGQFTEQALEAQKAADEIQQVYQTLSDKDKKIFAESVDFKKAKNKELMLQELEIEKEKRAFANLDSEAQKYELDAEVLKTHASQIKKALQEQNGEMENAAEVAAEMAVKNQRLNKGVDKLTDNWKDWKKALKGTDKTTQDYAEAVKELNGSVADILNLTEGSNIIPDNFWDNLENIDLMDQIANGSEEAVVKLGQNLFKASVESAEWTSDIAENIANAFNITDTEAAKQKFAEIKNNLLTTVSDMQNSLNGLSTGDMLNSDDATKFATNLNEYAKATKMSVEDMQSMLNTLGLKADIKTESQPMEYEVPEYTTYTQTSKVKGSDVPVAGGEEALEGKWQATKTYTVQSGTKKMKGAMTVANIAMGDDPNASAPQIQKIGSGNITPSVTSGGKNSGGGSKSKTPQAQKPPEHKKKGDELERYYEIDNAIEDQTNLLEELAIAKDEAWGADKLKAMQDEIKASKEELALGEERLRQIDEWLEKDKTKVASYGIAFDEDGRINNLEEIWEQQEEKWYQGQLEIQRREKAYEEAKNADENYDADGKIKLANEEYAEQVDKDYDEFMKAVEQYDNTLSEQAKQRLDNLQKELEIKQKNYEELEYKIELKVELNENDIADIEHQLERLGDNNVYASAERIALIEKNAASYRNIADIQMAAIKEAEQLYATGQITQTDYMARLQASKEALQEAEMSIRDGIAQIGDELENTFDLVDEKLDQQFTKFDRLIELMDHYKNVVSLTEGEASYKEFNKILKASQEVLRDRIAADESEVAMWESRRKQLEADIATLPEDSSAKREAEEALQAIMEKEADAKSQLMADIEQLGEYAREIFENSIEQAMKDFEDEMFGRPLNSIIESIEMMNSRQEELLTTTNKIYETNKLIRNVEKDIEATTNNRAKQAYLEFQNKVKQKQEQNELTKFELDLLTAEYEMTKAQIALEEAQNAKDTVRLTRDAEGNYGYVYTANEDKVADAEQALDDATNNYYNTALEGAQKYQDQIYQHIQEWEEKTAEVIRNTELNEEEKNKKIKEINDTYNTLITQDKNLYYMAIGAMQESAYNTQVDYDLKGIESAENWFTECDGFLSDLEDAQDEYDRNTEEISEHTEENFGKMSTAIRETKQESEYLKDQIVDELVPELDITLKDSIDNATEAWWKYIEALQEVIRLTDEAMKKNSQAKELGQIEDFSSEVGNQLGEEEIDWGYVRTLLSEREKKITRGDFDENSINYTEEMSKHQEGSAMWLTYAILHNKKIDKYGLDYEKIDLSKYNVPRDIGAYRTGGYTGAWGPEGRLAVLHEKELVLNAEDTQNFLSATNILREISQMLDRDALIASLGAINLRAMTLNSPADQVLQQEVTIHADFPNVTDHNEIEIAIDNLINAASQHAYRT